jgi:Domain of unknown function (DUF4365)
VADTLPIPRKQRTREHVIASQSINYVERFIYFAGHTVERFHDDYGYDLLMRTYDAEGYLETGEVLFQVKATDKIRETASGQACWISIDVADYNAWVNEDSPLFLVLYDARKRRAVWLYVQQYFEEQPARRPQTGAKSIRVIIPKRNRVGVAMIRNARNCQAAIVAQTRGVIHHV